MNIDAVLPCRNAGSRLFGKPLQPLVVGGPTVLDSLIEYIKAIPSVRNIVLAIAEGDENEIFGRVADQHGIMSVYGDEDDVVGRMIKAADATGADYLWHTSTECPFILYEFAEELIEECVRGEYDRASQVEPPEGAGFQILKADALRISHSEGEDRHRAETVGLYIFENKERFKLLDVPLPEKLRRTEVRLTVDYAEDLVFCQTVYRSLRRGDSLIPIEQIIDFWDENPDLRAPLENIGIDWGTGRLWE